LASLGQPGADRALAAADAVIAVIGDQWGADEFARLERCRLFVNPGVGLDAIDLQAAARLGIAVVNQPEVCTDEVADHTFALILACVRKVPWLSARVEDGAIFTNTSRGAIVDETDLLWAIDSGRLAAVGLDVMSPEPPDPANPLLQRPNVLVTPHAAGFSDQVVDDLQRLAVEEIVTV